MTSALLASITQPLIDFATQVVNDMGLPGIFVLMTLESACIPVPSEATMLFAGFAVSKGTYSLAAAVAVGVAGNLLGSWITWWLGRIGRVDLLEKHGARIGIRKHHIETADRWFADHGEATVFFARLLPVVRTFISLPAGAARMPFWRFTLYTLLGCIPWVLALTWAGQQAGDNWESIKHNLEYVDYLVVVAIIGAVVWMVVRARRGRGNNAESDVTKV